MWQRLKSIVNRKAGDPVVTEPTSSNGVWLVVGLGNPGPSYAGHRHNVGYLVADELASRMGSAFRPHKSGRADVVEGRLGGTGGVGGVRVVLARPRCYMNETGGPVSTLAKFYKVPIEQIVAIHDELDIPFDTMRVKLGGGDNGHNGLRSIMASGAGEFGRVRIGIGRPPAGFRGDVADFVLSSFDAVERAALPDLVKRAADAIVDIEKRGFAAAMKIRNTRPKPPTAAAAEAPPKAPDGEKGPRQTND